MKVLLVSFTYPPNVDGVSFASERQYEVLRSLGNDVTVVTSYHPERGDLSHIAQFDIRGNGTLVNPYRGELSKLYAFLKNNSWDVVISNAWQSWPTDILLSYFCKHKRREYLVLVSHCLSVNTFVELNLYWVVRYLLWTPYRWFTVKKVLKCVDRLVVLTPDVNNDRYWDYKQALRLGVDCCVIPNIAMYSKGGHKPLEKYVDMIKQKKVVLYLSNFGVGKNQMALIEAVKNNRRPDVLFVFVGHERNSYSEKIEKVKLKKSLSNLLILYGLTRDEINWLYDVSYLVLLFSKTECQSMVLVDAVKSLTPFIASSSLVNVSLDCGVYVDDSSQLNVAIDLLLDDKGKYEEIVAQMEKESEKFSFRSVKSKYQELLSYRCLNA